MKKLILIPGGAGFIGSHTADVLAKKGYRIRILDNLLSAVHNNTWPGYVKGRGYELIKGDVRKKKDWVRALRGVSYVYHFAAYQDQRPNFSVFFTTNTVSTALLYEIIVEKKLPIKKVILASSQFVYGDGMYRCVHTGETFFPELRSIDALQKKSWEILCLHKAPAIPIPFREDQRVSPTNSYGLSKHALEEAALRLGKTYGVPTVLMRYSIVQGPRQSPRNLYSGVLRIFCAQALTGKPITVYEDGKQKRDFVNIEDVVVANIGVLNNPKADFKVFNVGGGRGILVLDFAKLVKKITNSASHIIVSGFRRTDTRHAISDISKLKKLRWKPRFGPEKSIRDYINWLRTLKTKKSFHIPKTFF